MYSLFEINGFEIFINTEDDLCTIGIPFTVYFSDDTSLTSVSEIGEGDNYNIPSPSSSISLLFEYPVNTTETQGVYTSQSGDLKFLQQTPVTDTKTIYSQGINNGENLFTTRQQGTQTIKRS